MNEQGLRNVMQQIMQVLGPEPVCKCSGCAWETGEALRLLREAGIEYFRGKAPKAMPHNPADEELGNATGGMTDRDLLQDLAEWCDDFFDDKQGQWGRDAAKALRRMLDRG